jgi:hypothetical protein
MYITPAAFKFMILAEVENSRGKPRTVIVSAREFVFVRPKLFVPSSPAVWASEYLRIAWHAGELFDLKPNELSHVSVLS